MAVVLGVRREGEGEWCVGVAVLAGESSTSGRGREGERLSVDDSNRVGGVWENEGMCGGEECEMWRGGCGEDSGSEVEESECVVRGM